MAKETGVRPLDDLAIGLQSGAISRGKAIKLGGAALVASALGLFASAEDAQAQEEVEAAVSRRSCHRRGGDFCRTTEGSENCRICCSRKRRRKACCGPSGCNCCRRSQRCLPSGQCGE